jgi:hypothetical protein
MHRDKEKVDELRLGEDPESEFVGDAHHWLGVYSELLRLVDEAVLDLGHEHSLSQGELDMLTERFRRRQQFWEEKTRAHEAAGVGERQARRDEQPTD